MNTKSHLSREATVDKNGKQTIVYRNHAISITKSASDILMKPPAAPAVDAQGSGITLRELHEHYLDVIQQKLTVWMDGSKMRERHAALDTLKVLRKALNDDDTAHYIESSHQLFDLVSDQQNYAQSSDLNFLTGYIRREEWNPILTATDYTEFIGDHPGSMPAVGRVQRELVENFGIEPGENGRIASMEAHCLAVWNYYRPDQNYRPSAPTAITMSNYFEDTNYVRMVERNAHRIDVLVEYCSTRGFDGVTDEELDEYEKSRVLRDGWL